MITFSPKMREFPRYFYKTQESEVLVLALLYFIILAWKFAHFGHHLGAASGGSQMLTKMSEFPR